MGPRQKTKAAKPEDLRFLLRLCYGGQVATGGRTDLHCFLPKKQ